MNATTQTVDAAALAAELAARGFSITKDGVFLIEARKQYQTAVGPREATVCLFRAHPNHVWPSYWSEGQNILDVCASQFCRDFKAALDECEQRIADSYAVRLLREFPNL